MAPIPRFRGHADLLRTAWNRSYTYLLQKTALAPLPGTRARGSTLSPNSP